MTVILNNRGYLGSEHYYLQAVGGESIKVVLHKDRPVDLFVQNGIKEIQVEPYDIPKELKRLRQDSPDIALLKTAYYSVSYFREGGCKVNLNFRLRGGMLDPNDVERSMQANKRSSYDENPRYVPPPPPRSEDRDPPPDRMDPNKRIKIIVGSSAVGGVVGCIGGVAGVVIGAGLGGTVGWFLSRE